MQIPKPSKLPLVIRQNIARQTGMEKPRFQSSIPPEIRNRIHFHYNPCNPDTDITPPGKYHLQTLNKTDNNTGESTQIMGCYNPEGRLIGTLHMDRIQKLYNQYQNSPISKEGTTFEEQIVKLILRYHKDYKPKKGQGSKFDNHWTIPPALAKLGQLGLSITIERFSSPLNNFFQHFYTIHPEDRYFNAKTDAFAHKYEGASENNPEYEPDMMEKDIRYALIASEQEAPHIEIIENQIKVLKNENVLTLS